jgi:predicted oxidoreductase
VGVLPSSSLSGLRGSSDARVMLGLWRVLDWGLDPGALAGRLQRALEMGIELFDLADIYGGYGAQRAVGEALRQSAGLRDRARIVTKCGICMPHDARPSYRVKHYDTTAAHIEASVNQTLSDLGVDSVDTLLLHRPDPLMDPEEVAACFRGLRASGKVARFGVSNFTPAQFEWLDRRLDEPLVGNQIEMSLLRPAALLDGTLDQLAGLGRRAMIWSPLGGGALFAGDGEQPRRVREALARVEADTGAAGIDQVALAWVLAHPSRPQVIVGSSRPERWQTALDALRLPLHRQHWYALLEASTGHEVA